MRKYKKPLAETRYIDRWKCPWCRSINTEPEWNEELDSVIHSEYVSCLECGKMSRVWSSPTFIANPVIDDDDW